MGLDFLGEAVITESLVAIEPRDEPTRRHGVINDGCPPPTPARIRGSRKKSRVRAVHYGVSSSSLFVTRSARQRRWVGVGGGMSRLARGLRAAARPWLARGHAALVHPTAHVSPRSDVHPTARVGAFAIVDAGARVGAGAVVGPGAHLLGDVRVGSRCVIRSHAVLGASPPSSPASPPPPTEIGDDAVIMEGASIARGCVVGRGAIVHPNAVIRAGTRVEAGADVGACAVLGAQRPDVAATPASSPPPRRDPALPLVLVGANALVGDASALAHCDVGEGCALSPGAVIGADGFGVFIDPRTGETRRHPQLRRVRVGAFADIGANATVDRGSRRDTRVGRGAKLDNLVHVGHNACVGERSVVCGQAGVGGSAEVGAGACWEGRGVGDHAVVPARSRVAAKAGRRRPGGVVRRRGGRRGGKGLRRVPGGAGVAVEEGRRGEEDEVEDEVETRRRRARRREVCRKVCAERSVRREVRREVLERERSVRREVLARGPIVRSARATKRSNPTYARFRFALVTRASPPSRAVRTRRICVFLACSCPSWAPVASRRPPARAPSRRRFPRPPRSWRGAS